MEGDSRADPLDLGDPDKSRRHRLEAAVDRLRAKHGTTKIIKGRMLKIDQNTDGNTKFLFNIKRFFIMKGG